MEVHPMSSLYGLTCEKLRNNKRDSKIGGKWILLHLSKF